LALSLNTGTNFQRQSATSGVLGRGSQYVELVVQHIASGKETSLRKANDETFAVLKTEAAQSKTKKKWA